jgi:hypothetical protein
MGYINAIVRDQATGAVSITPVPEPTLERAQAWASQHFAGCGWWRWSMTPKSIGGQLDGGNTITLVRHGLARPELVVTRHSVLVDVLRERGVIDDTTPVLSHATRGAVNGKHVLGILPNYLASLAASLTEAPMRLTNEDHLAMHAGTLSLERARKVIGDPVMYRIVRIPADWFDQ